MPQGLLRLPSVSCLGKLSLCAYILVHVSEELCVCVHVGVYLHVYDSVCVGSTYTYIPMFVSIRL